MNDIKEILGAIQGGSPPWIPSSKAGWAFRVSVAAIRTLYSPQLIASGPALTGGARLALAEGGFGAVLRGLAKREPLLCLGPTSGKEGILHSFLRRIELDPADACDAIVSIGGLLVVFGKHKGDDAVALIASGENTREQIARHCAGLTAARSDLAGSSIVEMMPKLLGFDEHHILESRISGLMREPAALGFADLRRVILTGLEVAAEIHRLGQSCSRARSTLLTRPELDVIVGLMRPQHRHLVERVLLDLTRWFSSVQLAPVPQHGDFWIGNLGFNKGMSCVTGIVDWEWYKGAGVPLLDAIHLMLMGLSMHYRIPVAQLLPQMWIGEDSALNDLLDRASAIFDLPNEFFQWIAIAVWLDYIVIGATEPRPRNFEKWLDEICTLPGSAVAQWLRHRSPTRLRPQVSAAVK